MESLIALWRRLPNISPRLFDGALAGGMTIFILIEASSNGRPFNPAILLMTVPLMWRRRWPLAVFAVTIVGAILALTPPQYAGIIALTIVAYSVGSYCRYRFASLIVLLATAAAIVASVGGALPSVPDSAGPFVVFLPAWLVGNAIRTRQLRADAMEDRAIWLELEQEQATRIARAEERTRLARELHDVVAHSVSVMVVQAGAARTVLEVQPEEAREALLAVETTGRAAMTELRTLLGVLAEEGDGAELSPQPGLDGLDALLRRVGEAGLPVELETQGTPQPLPPGIDLTAYRIVQEALTNALKYADLASTEVILDYRHAELKIEVLDDGPGHAPANGAVPGRGLVGMRERVAMYGGTLEAGPQLERGYAVRVWLPINGSDVEPAVNRHSSPRRPLP
ncbi:MAG: sensor histidine kinase [Chloroflexota bacterium]|nr:sensor histidine kinase [Chloroflexota bacterium]